MEFLTGHKLNAAIEDIIRKAEKDLLIVSPYIKLHERYMEALKTLQDKPAVRVTLLFGKANGDKSVTFHKDSITFFKSLPNIEIAHRKNLHAKFYANEDSSVMTSMNLYAYSQDVNIETGFRIDYYDSKNQAINAQNEALEHFDKIFNGADPMFDKEALFESKLLGLSKKYTGSEVTLDVLDESGNPREEKSATHKRKPRAKRDRIAETSQVDQTVKVQKSSTSKSKAGFCIATGTSIPFNIEKPMSYAAYKSWMKETNGNTQASMKYCHYSGEESSGHITVERPISKAHWKAAMTDKG